VVVRVERSEDERESCCGSSPSEVSSLGAVIVVAVLPD
jgi:hypothetical protein